MSDGPDLKTIPFPKGTQQDELEADVQQMLQHIPQFARLLAAEHAALVEEGVGSFAAAVLVGTRYKSGG